MPIALLTLASPAKPSKPRHGNLNGPKRSEWREKRQQAHFMETAAIAEALLAFPYKPLAIETSGDGLYMVFSDVRHAGLFGLELSALVHRNDWTQYGLPETLNLRIGLHVGPVYPMTNPITGIRGFAGTNVSHAARIEPITPPGQAYASQAFAALAIADNVTEFACDYVGQTPLAKHHGTFPTYHVRNRRNEKD